MMSFLLVAASIVFLTGCASDADKPNQKPTTRTSDKAMKDPYGDWSKVDDQTSTKKGTIKSDWDSFWMK